MDVVFVCTSLHFFCLVNWVTFFFKKKSIVRMYSKEMIICRLQY